MNISGEKACATADPEIFFPLGEDRANPNRWQQAVINEAKEFCGRCVLNAICLEYAIENKENYGIWGGLTTYERTRLVRRNNRKPA
jgi:WhiB family redox-sensing transcriptional regulator